MTRLEQALNECIAACGGSKQVGAALWPEKSPEAAQRALLDALNDERPAKLSPEQVIFIARMARERGCHAYVNHVCRELSYTLPVPVEPRDEMAELQRLYIDAAKSMGLIAARIEKLNSPPLARVA